MIIPKPKPEPVVHYCHCGLFQRPLVECSTGACRKLVVKVRSRWMKEHDQVRS